MSVGSSWQSNMMCLQTQHSILPSKGFEKMTQSDVTLRSVIVPMKHLPNIALVSFRAALDTNIVKYYSVCFLLYSIQNTILQNTILLCDDFVTEK